MAPADPMISTHSDGACPAWELYAAAHKHVSIPDLITDLLHLAEHLPDEHRDVDALLNRARRDYEDERR